MCTAPGFPKSHLSNPSRRAGFWFARHQGQLQQVPSSFLWLLKLCRQLCCGSGSVRRRRRDSRDGSASETDGESSEFGFGSARAVNKRRHISPPIFSCSSSIFPRANDPLAFFRFLKFTHESSTDVVSCMTFVGLFLSALRLLGVLPRKWTLRKKVILRRTIKRRANRGPFYAKVLRSKCHSDFSFFNTTA